MPIRRGSRRGADPRAAPLPARRPSAPAQRKGIRVRGAVDEDVVGARARAGGERTDELRRELHELDEVA